VIGAPAIRAAAGGLTRHLAQTLVIISVLTAATATATLGMSLLTNANEAFVNGTMNAMIRRVRTGRPSLAYTGPHLPPSRTAPAAA